MGNFLLDKVVIATGNIGKYRELNAILTELSGGTFAREIIFAPELESSVEAVKPDVEAADDAVEAEFIREFSSEPEIKSGKFKIEINETGRTYAANARIKAQAWVQVSGLPCLADDSGLEVEALNGAPGIYSARIAPGDDNERIKWILDNLRLYHGRDERRARFVANLMLIIPPYHRIQSVGICNGHISENVAGSGGFGYDPIFIPDGFDVSFAELSAETKNKISHRALAVKNLLKVLKKPSLNGDL